jgi:hypothetical protein
VRNKVNAGETMPTCLDVACCVSSVIREIQGDVVHRLPNLNMQRRVWKPPGTDQLKINFDGAFCSEDRKAACGFIIRKHVGEAVLAGAANISPALDALSAESAACLFALEAAEHFGISRIELETDSSQVREAITSTTRDLAPNGVLFRCICDLLEDHFSCIKVINVPHTCSSSAHEIAKIGMSWDQVNPLYGAIAPGVCKCSRFG